MGEVAAGIDSGSTQKEENKHNFLKIIEVRLS